MKELWVHSGFPKNGSSAIQVFLAQNIDALRKEGLDYTEFIDIDSAKEGKITAGNGVKLAIMLREYDHAAFSSEHAAFYNRTLEKIKNSPSSKVLISSEFFAQAKFDNIKKLKDDLSKMGIVLKMIYYVRRQEQFLMSEYMQKVKRGGFEGYPDEYILAHYTQYEHLNYYAYTKRYADLLGKENIHPWIYELTKKHEKGIVGHFLETILGTLPQWVEPVKSINTSPTPWEIKFMLACNQYHPRMNFSDTLVENSVLRGKSDSYQSHNLIDDAAAEKVISHFKEQNEKFTETYTGGNTFPAPKETPYTSLAQIQISPDELLNIVSGYLVRYDKRITALEAQAKQTFLFRLQRRIKRIFR